MYQSLEVKHVWSIFETLLESAVSYLLGSPILCFDSSEHTNAMSLQSQNNNTLFQPCRFPTIGETLLAASQLYPFPSWPGHVAVSCILFLAECRLGVVAETDNLEL